MKTIFSKYINKFSKFRSLKTLVKIVLVNYQGVANQVSADTPFQSFF